MTVTVRDIPVTNETIERAGMNRLNGFVVRLADKRHKARSHVRLYRDATGKPYIRDRLYGRRDIVAVRVLLIDGEELNTGCVVLAPVER